jgi:small subunit ribosomal protein S9
MDNVIYTIGRRKSAIAQVKLSPGEGLITINNKPINEYLQASPALLYQIQTPLEVLGLQTNYNIDITVSGGGINGQAGAIQLGITRALATVDTSFRSILKPKGLLTRDPRVKERRKYGLKKARKAPQFSKR